jgi:hypothetical protein
VHYGARSASFRRGCTLVVMSSAVPIPGEVALSYMNNLAYAQGMSEVFRYSYFVGTFGEYDLGVIPRPAP